MIFRLLPWFLVIAGNIYLDRNGRKPNYLLMNGIRLIALSWHQLLFNPNEYELRDLAVVIFDLTSFWIFFELGLNIVRKKPLLYYDTKELDSGYIDRFFAWAGKEAHTIAKVLCFILMVLSLIVIHYAS